MVKTKKIRMTLYVDNGEGILASYFDTTWRSDVSLKEILNLVKIAIDEIE